MKKKIAILLLVLSICFIGYSVFLPTPVTAQVEEIEEVLKWDAPGLYDGSLYGKIVTVEGIVIYTYNSGKACFLNFHYNYRKYFTAVIFKSDFKKFDTPEDYYYFRKVRVRGMLKEYKGKPEIIIKTPSQIEVLK